MATSYAQEECNDDEDFKSVPKKAKIDTTIKSGTSGGSTEVAGTSAAAGGGGGGKGHHNERTKSVDENSDDNDGPIPIDSILGNGITSADIQRLKDHGIATVEGLMCTPKRKLVEMRGMSEAKVEKLMAAGKPHVPLQFVTATALHKQRSDLVFIGTGSKEVDKILAGGVETGSITEVFGEARSGKSQFVMTLAVRCQLPLEQGGAEGKALVIDTENSFRSERLLQIAEHYNLNPTDVLDNVVIAKAHTTDQQMELLVMASALLSESRFAVVIIDSATNLFRREYSGRATLADRQTQLNSFLGILHRFCSEFGVAVVICNQVLSQVDGMASMFGGQSKIPVGGNIMAHSSTTRLALRKGRGDNRIVRVYDSPCLPEAEAMFKISSAGIQDADDD